MKTQDIYKLVYYYEGTVYQSTRYFKSKEKAEIMAKKNPEVRAILWLRKENKAEILMYCFDLVREAV